MTSPPIYWVRFWGAPLSSPLPSPDSTGFYFEFSDLTSRMNKQCPMRLRPRTTSLASLPTGPGGKDGLSARGLQGWAEAEAGRVACVGGRGWLSVELKAAELPPK